ncbi:MAG: (2Fe-2S)-binding protein [Phycisphaerae bacterium]|nr:(2Fe-2S)-binding protein [Phycisphaerae bacterium]
MDEGAPRAESGALKTESGESKVDRGESRHLDGVGLTFVVNGESVALHVSPFVTLLDVLRNELELTGTKYGCGEGECGACSVILNGKVVNSCLVLALECEGSEVLTIEGLAEGGQLHRIQQAFVDHGAIQCGFCTPGMIMATHALLDGNPSPTEDEIKRGLEGNLCRCTGYRKIIDAVLSLTGQHTESAIPNPQSPIARGGAS